MRSWLPWQQLVLLVSALLLASSVTGAPRPQAASSSGPASTSGASASGSAPASSSASISTGSSTTVTATQETVSVTAASTSSSSSSAGSASASASGTGGAASSSSPSSTSVSTAVPSPSAAPTSPLFNATLPESQAWCAGRNGSRIYCPGQILQTVQLSQLYPDSKTFVDKPTLVSEDEVVAAFQNTVLTNGTIEALVAWIDQYFGGEGLDVVPATLEDFVEQPSFLDNIQDPIVKGWLQIVHGYWRDLARTSEKNTSCTDCVSSLIELPNTFIVPGGRFRENYYWDTYFALEGILTGGLQTTANQTIQNYLFYLENFGFIPNGARLYYLNRSQPPLFAQMLYLYVSQTNDTSFLPRAMELVEVEMAWWNTNRTVNVTANGQTYSLHRYDVDNTAPRPEGYLEDWETVNGPIGGPYLNLSTDLYGYLSSGAESGMDYSGVRWTEDPAANLSDTNAALRTLNIVNIVPVDLNAILFRNYEVMSMMYSMIGNSSRSEYWSNQASTTREAILNVFWDSEALLYKDWNITANAQHDAWTAACYWPYYSGIIPNEVLTNETAAQKAFSGLAFLTANYNGSIPTSLLKTGQQWDWPNVWPPHLFISLGAVRALPSNVTSAAFGNYSQQVLDFGYLPPGHFGNITAKDQLPQQNVLGGGANITNVTSFSELGNVGNLTDSNVTWAEGLATALANRYISAAFCSWFSTGGSIPGLLNQLPEADLNATKSLGASGNMFEKFNVLDQDAAGAGGEYTVQAGFAWTNGVAIWIGNNYGQVLNQPACPAIEPASSSSSASSLAQSMHRQMSLRQNLAKRL